MDPNTSTSMDDLWAALHQQRQELELLRAELAEQKRANASGLAAVATGAALPKKRRVSQAGRNRNAIANTACTHLFVDFRQPGFYAGDKGDVGRQRKE